MVAAVMPGIQGGGMNRGSSAQEANSAIPKGVIALENGAEQFTAEWPKDLLGGTSNGHLAPYTCKNTPPFPPVGRSHYNPDCRKRQGHSVRLPCLHSAWPSQRRQGRRSAAGPGSEV